MFNKVGDISFDVGIDAKNLTSELTAAVHAAVKPAMASIQRDMLRATASKGGKGGGYKQVDADLDRHMNKLSAYHGVLGQVNRMLDTFTAKTLLMGSTLAPVIGALGGALGVLGGGIGVVIGGVAQLATGMTALVPAILGVVAAVKIGMAGLKEGAKAYMAQFEQQNKVIAAQIGNLMGPMLTAWQEVSSRIKLDFAQALVPTFNNLAALIRAIGPSLTSVGQAFAGVVNNVTATLNALAPQFKTILEGSKTFLNIVGPSVQTLAKGILDLGASAQKAMPAIAGAIRDAQNLMGETLSRVAASPEFQRALQGFAQILGSVGRLLAGLVPVLVEIGAKVGPLFAQLVDALGPALNMLLQALGQLAVTVGPYFIQFVAALGPALTSVVVGLGKMGEIIGPTLVPLLLSLAKSLEPLYVPLANLGRILSEQLARILPVVGQGIADLIIPIAGALPTLGTLIELVAKIVTAASPALVGLAEGINSIAQGLLLGFEPLIPVIKQLAELLKPMLEQIGVALGGVLASLGPVLAELVKSLLPLAQVLGDIIVMAVNNLSQTIIAATPFLQQFFEMLGRMWIQLGPVLEQFINELGRVFPELMAQMIPRMTQLFEQLLPIIEQLLQMFIDMLPEMVQLAEVGVQALIVVLPILVGSLTVVATALERLSPLIEIVLGGLSHLASGISAAFGGGVSEITNLINWVIEQYNSKLKPIFNFLHLPAPDISPITGAPGGFMGPGGGTFGYHPNVPAGPTDRTKNGMANAVPPPGPPAQWAPPGPSTPVAPDLGDGKTPTTPGDKPLTTADLPLDMIAKTPEQDQLLSEIRDLLAGTGNSDAPLNKLNDLEPAVKRIGDSLKKTPPASKLPPGAIPGHMGPFGTPIPASDPGYEIAKAFIEATGGNVLMSIGPNPIEYAQQQWNDTVDQWQTNTTDRIKEWQALPTTPPTVPGAPTMPLMTAPTSTGGLNWTALAQAEAGGNWANKTNPKYMGGLQFDQATWDAYKPAGAPSNAADATPDQQIQAAQTAINARGGPQSLWPQNWQKLYEGTNIAPGSVPHGGGAGAPPWPTAPGLPGANIATTGSPIPVWVVGSGPMTTTAGAMPGATVPGMPAGTRTSILHDTGKIPTQAAGQNAAALIAQYFPQITDIGGSRDTGAAPGTHEIGRSLDINIPNYSTPQGVSLGNQIRDFLQQNAQQLGVIYTIWQDQGLNTGLGGHTAGSKFNVPGHMNHIDVQFADGGGMSVGPGGLAMPGAAVAPGVAPGAAPGAGTGVVQVYVTNWPGQPATGAPQGLTAGQAVGKQVLDSALSAGGDVAANVSGDVLSAVGNLGLESWVRRQPQASTGQLVGEGNPLAIASMAGFNVQDFTLQGGGANAADLMSNGGPGYDATGRLYSDTAALIDRTLTSLEAAAAARHKQLMDVMNQVRQRLTEEVLKPIMVAAVKEGFEAVKSATFNDMGAALGTSAAPPIADAVGSAVATNTPQTAGSEAGGLVSQVGNTAASVLGLAYGGRISGGIPGRDSVPALLTPGEHVLDVDDVAMMGGHKGVDRFRAALASGTVAHFATGGGVIGNATVGADWFGVSQLPIIGMVVNVLVRILLEVLGVQIEVRDTLNEITDEFRGFRGEFQGITSTGRLLTDTSGLVDRTWSSEQMAVDERLRILKQVLVALVKYIIEKVVIPIVKAVLKTLVNMMASAAGAATNAAVTGGSFGMGAAGGGIAGGLVESLISSGGDAAIDIGSEIIGDVAVSSADVLTGTAVDMLGGFMNDAISPLFGGGVEGVLSSGGGITGLFGNMFGGLLSGIFGGGTTGGGILPALLSGVIGGTGSIFGGLMGGGGGGLLGGLLDGLMGGGSGVLSGPLGGGITDMLGGLFGGVASDTGVGNVFSGLFNGVLGGLFGGASQQGSSVFNMFGGLFSGVLGSLFSIFTGLMGGMLGGISGGTGASLGGLFSGLATTMVFDNGGVASGTGYMPKATIEPERVLSGTQTKSFEKLVNMLGSGGLSGGNTITIHAPFHVSGGAQGAQEAHDKLLSLLN